MDWIAAKLWLVDVTGLEKDALHIYAGVGAQLLAARLFARRLGSPWPLVAVLLLTLANEAYDLVFEVWPEVDRARQWRLGLHDLLNTLAVPSLLFALARRPRPPASSLPGEAA